MKSEESIVKVREFMTRFAEETGLTPDGGPPRRYLWTDAFALCNFLELYKRTEEAAFQDLALRLVEQVHGQLGRHRQDDPRKGWISGLSEQEGRSHPTLGGLRIGKEMNERRPDEPLDDRLEWDRDGQYYHYLTKWMHALCRLSRVSGESKYHEWAVELAGTAQARFSYFPSYGRRKRMFWKMSIDLSYPLVPSMGQHDPLDGYVTFCQLQATTEKFFRRSTNRDLKAEIAELEEMCQGQSWVTDDPLGIGGLLFDACRLTQLMAEGYPEKADLLKVLLDSSRLGLESYVRQRQLNHPAGYRLAFRELGLSIGLRGLKKMQAVTEGNPGLFGKNETLSSSTAALMEYEPLIEKIEKFWLDPRSQAVHTWKDHLEINRVMLATSLAPDSFLSL